MIEKVNNRYVLADSDTGKYLKVELRSKKYEFVDDVEIATKCMDISIANSVKNRYHTDIKGVDKNIAIIPLKITYELLDEDSGENKSDIGELAKRYDEMFNISKSQKRYLKDGTECFVQFL